MGWTQRRKVPSKTLKRVKQLLAKGWSQRKVAANLGVAKTTVQMVAAGTFRINTHKAVSSENLRRPVVCDTCGGLVYTWPCKLCKARGIECRQRPSRRAPSQDAGDSGSMDHALSAARISERTTGPTLKSVAMGGTGSVPDCDG